MSVYNIVVEYLFIEICFTSDKSSIYVHLFRMRMFDSYFRVNLVVASLIRIGMCQHVV